MRAGVTAALFWLALGSCGSTAPGVGIGPPLDAEADAAPVCAGPRPETCNGLDDDCDGATDEGLGTTTCGVGACQRMGPSCDGVAGRACTPGEPAPEVCNGLDDDCDGASDDGLGATVCGVGVCQRTVTDCHDGIVQPCLPGEPTPEVCNGEDDDCDGLADEDLGTRTCGVGGCARTVDDCVTGVEPDCVTGAPSAESCNGQDDDCDGATDEDIGTITCGTGACERTVGACSGGAPQMCAPGDPGPEICDGLDNDCDAATDEGCACSDGQMQPCGTAEGACQPGMLVCTGGIWQACTGEVAPTPEACDGLDNDCDAATDEDQGATMCGTGQCERTLDNCASGMPQGCVPGAPTPEVCDGLDNDCDGSADELLVDCCVDFCCGPTCYEICRAQTPWSAADTACKAQGTCLATVNDAAEAACIASEMTALGIDIAWVGLKQDAAAAEPAGGWTWLCGSSSWLTWNAGEPNDSWAPEEDCGEIWAGPAALNDWICDGLGAYVCELDPCGNGVCDSGEDCTTCPADCPGKTSGPPAERHCCGDGLCEPPAEDPAACPVDCP